MVGYVWVRESAGLLDRISTVTTLFVGRDTWYGLGRLERVSMAPATTLFGATVGLDQDEPRIVTTHRSHTPMWVSWGAGGCVGGTIQPAGGNAPQAR
jgi:hypothetical protein